MNPPATTSRRDSADLRIGDLLGFAMVLFAIAAVYDHLNGSRFSNNVYLVIAILQVAALGVYLQRGSLMTTAIGFCLTIMLLVAVAVERSSDSLVFRGVYLREVYTPDLISSSYNVLVFSTCLFHGVALLLGPKRRWAWGLPDAIEASFAKRWVWLSFFIGAVFLAFSNDSVLVTQGAYGYSSSQFKSFLPPEFSLLGTFFLVFALVAASRASAFNRTQYYLLTLLTLIVVVYFALLRGHRGAALGVFATIGLLYVATSSRPLAFKVGVLCTGVLSVLFLYQVLSYVRVQAAGVGIWPSISDGWRISVYRPFIEPLFSGGSNRSIDYFSITMVPQGYWHLLHTIDLYRLGISLHGSSIINLAPESIPSFLTSLFHYQRPVSTPELLGQYRIHGGGIFVIAEGYWNFGFAGAALVAAFLAGTVTAMEHWYRKQPPVLAATYFAFLGAAAVSVFFGLQPLVRALEITVVLAILSRSLIARARSHQRIGTRIGDRARMTAGEPSVVP